MAQCLVVSSLPALRRLDDFRAVQRLAYDSAEAVAATLEPGITEREAARRLRTRLVANGVDDWFHLPFAWFGDRTAFRGFKAPLQFFPTDRKLEEGMPYILDCAPVVRGATADIGYSGALGSNAIAEQIQADLAAHRALIVDLARERWSLRAIYQEVDRLAARQGFENRHRAYPGHVIAHEVRALRPARGHGQVLGFGVRHLRSLGRSIVVGQRQGWSPLWAGGRRSDHPPMPGLWAVEPHLAFRDVGAKFEELLVITDDGDAFWLDDDLPHVRRWQARDLAGARS
jgi:Xaa-Pro aminopeptidase